MPKRTKGFFYKTFSTIALVSIAMQVITLSVLAYYMLVPLANRSANDLANLILFSAEHWAQLKPEQHADFSTHMREAYNLSITEAKDELTHNQNILIPPYVSWINNTISEHQGKPISAKANFNSNQEKWFWIDVPLDNQTLRFGFAYSRIGVNLPGAFFAILSVGLIALLLTTTILTRRLTKPIDQLYNASKSLGRGDWPEPIQAKGPEELVVLTQQFNRMNQQVQDLLGNRTVLLAGIAHDLRTPLTQIHLALSMLPNDGGNTELMQSIQQDLDKINRLIGESLKIATALNKEEECPSNFKEELDQIVATVSQGQSNISLSYVDQHPCQAVLYPIAFNRVLTNLITNALRYSDNQPIDVVVKCSDTQSFIQIKDRGPGIDQSLKHKVFQPFYRLDKTRNSATGGSGLGLAIVRQLADLHNWQIELKDRTGGGTNAVLIINHQEQQ